MEENEWLADRFEEHRAHLRTVAYRMLGPLTEAGDAVQDTWLRLSQSGAAEVENLGGVEPPGQPDLPRGAYWSPKNRRTRPDLRAATRRNGSENTT